MFKPGDKVKCIKIEKKYEWVKKYDVELNGIYHVISCDNFNNIVIKTNFYANVYFYTDSFELVSSPSNNLVAANPLPTASMPLKSHHRENVMGCECGAYAVKDHFHSTWCPVSKVG